ncbi:MAG: hypothetical protein LBT00_05495 [Spirochaetaceae bacterium]|nr:hypothetical protein [Spirochaetaceae bacterium]
MTQPHSYFTGLLRSARNDMGLPSLRGAKRRSNPAGEDIHTSSTQSVEPIASLRSQ